MADAGLSECVGRVRAQWRGEESQAGEGRSGADATRQSDDAKDVEISPGRGLEPAIVHSLSSKVREFASSADVGGRSLVTA